MYICIYICTYGLWARTDLKARTGLKVSSYLWGGSKSLIKKKNSLAGRKRKIGDSEVTIAVQEFLLGVSEETSRFCRTKQRHRKASSFFVFFSGPGFSEKPDVKYGGGIDTVTIPL